MKPASIVGILLMILGIVALSMGGIHYTQQKKVIDMGPIQAQKTEHKSIPLPPVLGGIALVGGIVLVVVGSKKS